ncbi:hypothetical protein J6590_025580 [Homalodisca vitripennis]|nr:hypothetical protein J6590_025580 [Homalodisca vitripennis]
MKSYKRQVNTRQGIRGNNRRQVNMRQGIRGKGLATSEYARRVTRQVISDN